MPPLISHDGRWWWDGRQWQSRSVDGPLDLFWFTTTPDWMPRIALTGLIGLIPIVGSINLLGWTLVATGMVRQRWRELPPAGFHYLERGVAPFIVTLVYGVVVLFALFAMGTAVVALLVVRPPRVAAAIAVGVVLLLVLIAWWLLSLYLFAAFLLGSDRLGIARMLNPAQAIALARRNSTLSLEIGVTVAVASLALSLASVVVSVVPFGGLVVVIALPAVYALVVPKLARFEIE